MSLKSCHILGVINLVEIKQAISELAPKEKRVLSAWLVSQEDIAVSAKEDAELLVSLDRAAQQLDSGRGLPLEAVHDMVRRLALK